ncbi:four-carbon acid sugar kinase family protein [Enterococcus sp. LJL120]
MGKIGIIADDLTGATTVGVLLARSGITTAAYFSPTEMVDTADQEAIVLSSNSRHMKPADAQAAIAEAIEALKIEGATYFSKRIDTTLRGGIGYEIDEMLAHLPEDTVGIMVPAMPQSNRILVGGYSVIDGTALQKTDVAQDVLTPIKETHVPTMIDKQTQHRTGQLGLSSLLAGKEAVKAALSHQKSLGAKIIICDAISLDEIELIAECVHELAWSVLAIDPGPFTQKLAIQRGFGSEAEPESSEAVAAIMDGKVIVVAGSATAVTKQQINLLCENESVSKVSVAPLAIALDNAEGEAAKLEAIEAVGHALSDNQSNVIVLETAVSGPRLDLADVESNQGMAKGQAARNINAALSEIVKTALEQTQQPIKGIYMTGGDTMVSTLKTLGASGIALVDYVIPQTDLGRIIGGPYDGVVTIGKGGLTGKEDTAIVAVKRIFQEADKKVSI